VLSIITYLLAAPIALLFSRPEITTYVQIASLTIFGNSLFKISNSSFVGIEKMEYQSISLIVQSSLKAALSIILVLANFGVYGAVMGHTVAFIVSGVFAILLLYLLIFKKLKKSNDKTSMLKIIKRMLRYGLPESGALIMAGFLLQFYAFLIAFYLSDQVIGNYNLALNFSVIVAFFVQPIQTLLFPAFSKIDGEKDPETLQNVFIYSVKYSSLLVLPATFMVMALSQPAVATIFPGRYEQTPLYLSLYIITFLYTCFGRLSSNNLIKSQGRTDINLKLGMLTTFFSIILAVILIPIYGILGLMASYLISPVPQFLISLLWIRKEFDASIDYISSARIFLASLASGALTYFVIQILNLPNIISLLTGVIVYGLSYLVISPLSKAITKDDVKNLKEMLKPLGPLANILNIPLNIINKIAK
jgi:O-antigen/teichoic acid export membrane protein